MAQILQVEINQLLSYHKIKISLFFLDTIDKINTVENEVVFLLSNKDPKGIELLYDKYSSTLHGYIYRILKSEEVSEEVLQEVILRIWDNFSSYDSSKGKLFTWMVNITRHLAIDKLRSKEYKSQLHNVNDDNIQIMIDKNLNYNFNPETIGVKSMMNSLDKEKRDLVELVYFFGYTQSEVSEKLKMPLGTVKTKIRAALKTLREKYIGS